MRRILFLLWILPAFAVAQKNYSKLIDDYMQAQVKVNHFNGNLLVTRKGTVLYEKSFGLADVEWKIPLTASTLFQVGSVTKQFTASAVMQLVEQGKVSLDDKLSTYFPGFPKGDSVTVHMLLNHTSGIFDYTEIDGFMNWAQLALSTDSLVARFKDRPYNFSPGTKWRYCNSGYFLLGMIIEKASGMSWRNFVYRNVIGKAGLQHTDINRWDSVMTGRARGYERAGEKVINAPYVSMEIPYAAGAIISTTHDLDQWTRALYKGKVVSPASLKKMTTPYMGKYGYALLIDSTGNHKRIWHNGGIPGFETYLGHYPDEDITIVVFSNFESGSTRIGTGIGGILFGEKVEMPGEKKGVALSAEQLRRFIGTFELQGPGVKVIISEKDGKLFALVADGAPQELKPSSPNTLFVVADPAVTMDYTFNPDGSIQQVFLNQGGRKMELKEK
jgi:CubicO group peptidase (beta-lactamase class C family)